MWEYGPWMVILNGGKKDIFWSPTYPHVDNFACPHANRALTYNSADVGSCGATLYILNSSHNHRIDFFGVVKSKDKQEMME